MYQRLLAVSLIALATCAHDTGPAPTGGTRWSVVFSTRADGEELCRALRAEFEKTGLDARLEPVEELPDAEVPAWLAAEREGWVVRVPVDRRAMAEAARDAWLAKLGVRSGEETPPSRAEPFAFGPDDPLSSSVVVSIQAEIGRRVRLDQAVRTDPDRRGEMAEVDAANVAWLKETTGAHGWIDARRFGPEAANAAFLIVQHSGDRSLMAAALPKIEEDLREGLIDAQGFSLLFDRLQILSGGRQRYGTQVMQDPETGEWFVGRLEDPDRVDEFRESIGLVPLETYLSGFDTEVRIRR